MAGQFDMDGYYIDIVMCIDVTAGMTLILDELKSKALTLYQSVFQGMEDEDKEVAQLRVKVIAFRDYLCDEIPMQESEFFVLPEQNEEFVAFVNRLTASGGGDFPENGLEALALAIKSDWIREVRSRHAVVMLTDAPAHALGKCADCPGYPEGMPKDFAQLSAWWDGTDPNFKENQRSRGLFLFAPEVEPWTDMMMWNCTWPTYCPCGGGLAELDMEDVINVMIESF